MMLMHGCSICTGIVLLTLVTSSTPAAPCREQLLYELPVGVAVGGVEHAHYLVHQDDHAAGIAVVCQQERFRSEVGHDRAPQYRLPSSLSPAAFHASSSDSYALNRA